MRTDDRPPTTPLGHLARSLRARASTPSGQATPAAILWTDPKAEWRALLSAALARIPELLALGEYRPDHRTGPAIWLRCVVDRVLDIGHRPPRRHPHHLPPRRGTRPAAGRRGLSRRTEAARRTDVPRRPLAPPERPRLERGGVSRLHRRAGLDIAPDHGTNAALLGALDQVALTPVEQLRAAAWTRPTSTSWPAWTSCATSSAGWPTPTARDPGWRAAVGTPFAPNAEARSGSTPRRRRTCRPGPDSVRDQAAGLMSGPGSPKRRTLFREYPSCSRGVAPATSSCSTGNGGRISTKRTKKS